MLLNFSLYKCYLYMHNLSKIIKLKKLKHYIQQS